MKEIILHCMLYFDAGQVVGLDLQARSCKIQIFKTHSFGDLRLRDLQCFKLNGTKRRMMGEILAKNKFYFSQKISNNVWFLKVCKKCFHDYKQSILLKINICKENR